MSIPAGLIKLWKSKWQFGAVIVLLSSLLALALRGSAFFEKMELKTYDIRFVLRGHMPTTQDSIVIVGIDDATFAALRTRWPIPRLLFAKAILNLIKAEAKLIVLDVEFAEPDSVNARQDSDLARVVSLAGNVVLAGKISKKRIGSGKTELSVSFPMSLLLDAGARWGLINIDDDPDGTIRRYPAYMNHAGETYFPLSMQAFLTMKGLGENQVQIAKEKDQVLIGGKRLSEGNSWLINYRGPTRSFATYSFASVIDDQTFRLQSGDRNAFEKHLESGTFKNKVVFIGATSELLQDNKITPFFKYKGRESRLPGVELHANALSTLLRGDYIGRQSLAVLTIMLFLLSGLTVYTIKRLGPLRGSLASLGIATAYILWTIFAFINNLTWVEVVSPLTGISLAVIGAIVHEALTGRRELRQIKKTWQNYIPKHVVDSMVESGEMPNLGGERRELTVLFSNIRGFSRFSERHSSQEVVGRLNQYRTAMVDVIFKHSGTLGKFVGDEIMTIFGAPQAYPDHAEKACLASLRMLERASSIRKAWADDLDEFAMGVGINTGNVILGNIGSSQVFDYSVIGDDVNLGAQLEAANHVYGTSIILSEFTYKSVRRKARVRELDRIEVEGKNKPVRIFELLGMDPLPLIEQDLLIHVYTQGLKLYKAQKWYEALIQFKRIVRYFPTDGPTRFYIKRCLDSLESPPPEGWDGVHRNAGAYASVGH